MGAALWGLVQVILVFAGGFLLLMLIAFLAEFFSEKLTRRKLLRVEGTAERLADARQIKSMFGDIGAPDEHVLLIGNVMHRDIDYPYTEILITNRRIGFKAERVDTRTFTPIDLREIISVEAGESLDEVVAPDLRDCGPHEETPMMRFHTLKLRLHLVGREPVELAFWLETKALAGCPKCFDSMNRRLNEDQDPRLVLTALGFALHPGQFDDWDPWEGYRHWGPT